MKLSRISVAILFASVLLMVAMIPSGAARKGPREDDMVIYFYGSQETAFNALTTGAIDFMIFDLTSSQADLAFQNPNIVTVKVPDSGFYEFDLNNNYTIDDYETLRSPMNYTEMRQAVAFCSDKDTYIDSILGGKAARIDQMIAAPYYGWANESWSFPNYPYEFSTLAASQLLDTKFPQNTSQPNPDYDPLIDGSTQWLRNYPDDHPQKAHNVLDGLITCVRNEHSPRLQAGRLLYANLRAIGVPCTVNENPMSVLKPIVMDAFNYHIYTGGWSTGRFPPLTLYGLYHSINSFPLGSDYVTGSHFPFVGDNATDPRLYRGHPHLDDLLYDCNYALTYSEAVTACKLAAGYMTEICVNVPLWSVASYWAWNTHLLGVVNLQGNDPENGYTYMNAYKDDGSPIRCGAINPPNSMNIVYSSWVYDFNNLDRMFVGGGVDVPAYNVAADQAGLIEPGFVTTTWDDGGENKTLVRMTFRNDSYFVKPFTGFVGEHLNASHYFWNSWLETQLGDGWGSSGFVDLHHIDITGDYSFDIYFNTLSYWNTYYCQYYLKPMDTWMAQGPAFIASITETITAPAMPGPIALSYDPIWFTSVTAGGNALALTTDYNLFKVGAKGELRILTPQTGDLVVTYYYIPTLTALRGYIPGALPWQVMFEGSNTYYCTAFTAGLGGSATYRRNPFMYMVTPLLGEIDFVKKPSGNYKIDVFDLALAGGAYGSQGTGVPSANWFPGADLAPNGGVIDVLDIVTVTGVNWDKEFDPIEP